MSLPNTPLFVMSFRFLGGGGISVEDLFEQISPNGGAPLLKPRGQVGGILV